MTPPPSTRRWESLLRTEPRHPPLPLASTNEGGLDDDGSLPPFALQLQQISIDPKFSLISLRFDPQETLESRNKVRAFMPQLTPPNHQNIPPHEPQLGDCLAISPSIC